MLTILIAPVTSSYTRADAEHGLDFVTGKVIDQQEHEVGNDEEAIAGLIVRGDYKNFSLIGSVTLAIEENAPLFLAECGEEEDSNDEVFYQVWLRRA